jgi:hydroxybutyrate-dimer hydrolase
MRILIACLPLALLAGCAPRAELRTMPDEFDREIRVTTHAGADDLLTAGLGLDGLRGPPPAFADPVAPTPAELRRRAIWSNWRGIVDLRPEGGFGSVYGSTAHVEGREYATFATPPGAGARHRLLAQVPDAFDRKARCLVVAPVSGSRGAYGTIGFAGSWALPRGCAVVYTDKGLGTDLFDAGSGTGVRLDGTRGAEGELAFVPPGRKPDEAHRIAFAHAHSQANPEADWGAHVLQALRFGLHALDRAFPDAAPFTPDNTRILGAALSNGGGALLRAAELPGAEAFDAVIAAAPNLVLPEGRALYDYALDAALYQPCLFADPDFGGAPGVLPPEALRAAALARCASLRAAGLLQADTPLAQAREARAHLRAAGWEDAPLALAAFHSGLDLWRSLIATYTQAYARAAFAEPLCGFRFQLLDAAGAPRAASAAERAAWWADGNGIAPGMGIVVRSALDGGADPTFAGLDCARRLRAGADPPAQALARGIDATRANGRPRAPRVLVVHGAEDGLVPAALSARAWVRGVEARGYAGELRYWEIPRVQHFDAFLGLPAFAGRMLPLLPYAHQALDLAWAALEQGTPLAPPGEVANRAPATGVALDRQALGHLAR